MKKNNKIVENKRKEKDIIDCDEQIKGMRTCKTNKWWLRQ